MVKKAKVAIQQESDSEADQEEFKDEESGYGDE
jgi:hypothetical protein